MIEVYEKEILSKTFTGLHQLRNDLPKVRDAFEDLQNFVKDVFTPEGRYQEKTYYKNIGGCKYCPFFDRVDLCDRKNN